MELFEQLLKVFLGFLGLTGLLFSIEFCSLIHNPLKHWVLTHFHHLIWNQILKYRRRWKVGNIRNLRIDTFVP